MASPQWFRASVAVAILVGACTPDDAARPTPKLEAGAWRARIRTALFERTAKDGTTWGRERLDPLVTDSTDHLLEGPSQAAAVEALDALAAALRAGVGISPVERALIQRDLWAIHDWAIEPIAEPGSKAKHAGTRATLAARLAAAIRSVALTAEEIAALPDPYAQTIAAKVPPAWDPEHPLRAFLPADLFDPSGSWVCLGDADGRALAPHHRRKTRAHASFAVFGRLPAGRDATVAWIAQAAKALAPHADKSVWPFGTDFPNPPRLTQFAVVRRALLIDRDGAIRASPLVERVELRVHDAGVKVPMPDSTAQHPPGPAVVEWNLDGARLLRRDTKPLVPVAEGDADFVHFEDGKGGDLFEEFDEPHPTPSPILASCLSCHAASMGVFSIHSITHAIGPTGPLPSALIPSTPQREADLDVRAKASRPDLRRLRAAFSK